MKRVSYNTLRDQLGAALTDLCILSGDIVGPSDVSWQDVAGTAAVNLSALATLLERARNGEGGPALVFPSPVELLENVQ